MPTDDARAPHFAMGDFNESSSRRVGEQMVADIVAHFGEKTRELLAASDILPQLKQWGSFVPPAV